MIASSQPIDDGIAGGFDGMRVVAFESRMAREAATMIERYGGVPLIAPSMQEVALENNSAALDFGERLLNGEVDVAIFLTGVGAQALFRVLETRWTRAAVVEACARILTVARGSKPARALRAMGLNPSLVIAEPATWRELLKEVGAAVSLAGKRVALQEYGVSNPELVAGLERPGAIVTRVPVYRWELPADLHPLRTAIRAIIAGEADVALFTSSNQVSNVMAVADSDGIADDLRRGLAEMAIGSVGPMCSERLRQCGIAVDFEPEHPKLGHLIKTASESSAALLRHKRETRSEIKITAAGGSAVSSSGGAPAADAELRQHPLLRACRRETVPYTPVWLMRQAGRYMPEYRRVRDRYGFIEMCRTPELATEVTVTAVRRLGVDAAIIFADILLPLMAMGVGVSYEEGGPAIEKPIRDSSQIDAMRLPGAESLSYVGESIRLTRRELNYQTPVIGFAGAPFTLASYLVEGGSSRNYQATKTLMYTQEEAWHRLMRTLAQATSDYLNMQIDTGADAVQLFDSWVGALAPDDYRRFVLPHSRAVIAALRPGVPVIHFGTMTGSLLQLMREAGGDVIGLDWRVDLAQAWAQLGEDVAVQGNLDPVVLFADPNEIRRRVQAILNKAAGRNGHIFNLGHGILPQTPVDHVIALVDAVHEISRR